MRRQWRVIALTTLLLGGCGTWFGESDKPPLPGQRVSVLEHQRSISADPQATSEQTVLPPAVLNADWPQAGGDSAHAMQVLQAGEIGRPIWQADIGSGIGSSEPVMPSPVVAAGRVFTMDTENVVSAFDANTGKRLWRVDLTEDEEDDDAAPGGIAWSEGRLFATTGFGKVIALNADSGKQIWRHAVGIPMHAPPTVAEGRVFAITVENELHALRVSDGEDAWPPFQALAEMARLLGGANPAVAGGIVVAPFSSGELVALRADNGRPLWSESLAPARRIDELSSLAQIRARPVIDGGRTFAISAGGILAGFDLRTGQRIWDRDIGGQQSPWLAGRQIYQVINDAKLVCVSADTGRIHWVTQLPAFINEKKREEPILWAGPALASDRLLLVGSDGRLLQISPQDGRIIDNRRLADSFTVAPVIAGGMIFLLDDDGELSAYR